MLTDKNAADGYIEGIIARIHYKTGGHFKTFEEFADGSRILLTDSKVSILLILVQDWIVLLDMR